MKTKSILFLLTFLLISGMTAELYGDVFSLWPFSGERLGSDVKNTLQGETLWTEEIKVNGRTLDMEVTLVQKTLRDALQDLRAIYKKGTAAANSNSLLFEIPLKNGSKQRYYLVELGGIVPMLQFSMHLPANFKKGKPSHWPQLLPLPPGGIPETVMEFPKRDSVYAMFSTPYQPEQVLSDLTRALQNRGWKNVGGETNTTPQASGEIFMKENPLEIVILTILPPNPQNRMTMGTMYHRKLKK
ncbi:MAG: hypothetical protein J6W81_10600 [Lentisphaeria bacterium]|nr:hypothetical protein [Lentisphaeria bacterium]